MNRYFALMLLMIALSAQAAPVKFTGFGIGMLIGDPTAFSFKGHMGNDRYFDVALAYNNGLSDEIYAHGDYIVEKQEIFQIKEEVFNLYYGIGGRLFVEERRNKSDETHLGLRVPVGVNYYFKEPSIEVFGEVAAVMDITPETEADFDFSIGGRFWF